MKGPRSSRSSRPGKLGRLEDAVFSGDFLRFLRAAVPSVDAVELLLLLERDPTRWWGADEAVAALLSGVSRDAAEARRCFRVFQATRLAVVGPDRRVRYQPGITANDEHVRTLARAYRERPVTLIRVIYRMSAAREGSRPKFQKEGAKP